MTEESGTQWYPLHVLAPCPSESIRHSILPPPRESLLFHHHQSLCPTLFMCPTSQIPASLLFLLFTPLRGTPSPDLRAFHAVVSDAAWGGQTLMCAATFVAVKEHGRELGRVTQDGLKRTQAMWSWTWWRCGRGDVDGRYRIKDRLPFWLIMSWETLYWCRSRKEVREAEAVMLDMGLWGSSALPSLLSPQHFRDTTPRTPDSSSAEMTRGRGRTVTDYQKTEERVSSARGPIIVAAAIAELHGEPLVGTGGDEEGSGSADKDRQSRGSGRDEESSSQPSPSNALHTSTSFIPDDAARATPHRSSLVKRLGSYLRIQPPPQLLQLYQVCIRPSRA